MKRALPILLVLAAIGGVVAYRINARQNAASPPASQAAKETGRTAPVTVAPLPKGLAIDGTFLCHELSVGTAHTARATGATLRNTSGRELQAGFTFEASTGDVTQTVQNAFTMKTTDTFDEFIMASKRIPRGLDDCKLSFVLDPPPGFAAGQGRTSPAPSDELDLERAAKGAGCSPPASPKIVGRGHIDPPVKGTYNSTPPTSGNHYGSPAKTGVHSVAVPNEYQVHNLEHGHIGIQYGKIDEPARKQLERITMADPSWIFAAPYAGARFAVAFTAWGHVVTCDRVTGGLAGVARAFIRAYKDLAPESIAGTPT